MCLQFKRTWPDKSCANCKRNCRQWKKRKSSADPLKTAKPIWRLCRATRCFIGLTSSAAIQKKLSSSLKKQRNSIQTSPEHLQHWPGSTIGITTTSIRRLRERKKREPQQCKRFVCSRTSLRHISQWVFIITIASVTIRQRSTNSPLRSSVCQTPRKFICPLVPSNVVRANGKNPPRICRRRRP